MVQMACPEQNGGEFKSKDYLILTIKPGPIGLYMAINN
jgi:hypothetical protein